MRVPAIDEPSSRGSSQHSSGGDKANPVKLSRNGYPEAASTHQGWLTSDHRWFWFGDEHAKGHNKAR